MSRRVSGLGKGKKAIKLKVKRQAGTAADIKLG